jgi:hypothetical protein
MRDLGWVVTKDRTCSGCGADLVVNQSQQAFHHPAQGFRASKRREDQPDLQDYLEREKTRPMRGGSRPS